MNENVKFTTVPFKKNSMWYSVMKYSGYALLLSPALLLVDVNNTQPVIIIVGVTGWVFLLSLIITLKKELKL